MNRTTALPDLDVSEYQDAIRRDGVAIVPNVVPAGDVADLREAVDRIPLGDEVRRKQNVYGIRNLLEVCPAVRELSMSPSIRSLVTMILGENCFAVRAVFFDKVPDANWKLGWHQDSVIAVRERIDLAGFVGWSHKAGVLQVQPPAEVLAEMLAIRVYLDDSDEHNGPLRVLPGSHRFGWLDDEIDNWKQKVAEISCHVPAGGILAMRPLLLHASAAAVHPTHRRVIHIEYAHQELPGGLDWHERLT